MKRSEIWWADLYQPIGRRPVLLLSRDEAYTMRSLITICPVTTRIRELPVEIHVGKTEGLNKPSVINLDYILTIPISTLDRKIGRLSKSKRRDLDKLLMFTLGIESD